MATNTPQQAKNTVSTGVDRAKDAVNAGADKAKDLASSGASAVKQAAEYGIDKAKDLASTAGQYAGQAADKAREYAGQAGQAASQMASQAADRATGSVGGGLESLAHTIRDNAPNSGMLGSAASTVASTLEQGGKYISEQGLGGMAEDITSAVRRNPLQSILVAVAVGFLLARATRS